MLEVRKKCREDAHGVQLVLAAVVLLVRQLGLFRSLTNNTKDGTNGVYRVAQLRTRKLQKNNRDYGPREDVIRPCGEHQCRMSILFFHQNCPCGMTGHIRLMEGG